MDYRLPTITQGSPEESIRQLQKYLFQLVQELNANQQSAQMVQRNVQILAQDAAMAAQKSPRDTFLAIRDLIIKSADIVEVYQEKIETSLAGKYVAQSDFGTYTEETAARIEANSKRVEQVYQSQQAIETDVAVLEGNVLAVQAVIRTGEIDVDSAGFPIYGLEIGQQNMVDGVVTFQKFARLAADRLSFFDQNGTEVAYISDNTMTVKSANMTDVRTRQLTIGDYTLSVDGTGHLSVQ